MTKFIYPKSGIHNLSHRKNKKDLILFLLTGEMTNEKHKDVGNIYFKIINKNHQSTGKMARL